MVVVDRFTKMAHFISLVTDATAKDVADTILGEVWRLHGLLSEIISDMDAKFSGKFWESLCKSLGIKRRMSTAYYPQTDGQTEKTNQVLEGYLCCLSDKSGKLIYIVKVSSLSLMIWRNATKTTRYLYFASGARGLHDYPI